MRTGVVDLNKECAMIAMKCDVEESSSNVLIG